MKIDKSETENRKLLGTEVLLFEAPEIVESGHQVYFSSNGKRKVVLVDVEDWEQGWTSLTDVLPFEAEKVAGHQELASEYCRCIRPVEFAAGRVEHFYCGIHLGKLIR